MIMFFLRLSKTHSLLIKIKKEFFIKRLVDLKASIQDELG